MSFEVLIAILILSPLVGFLINGPRYKSKNYLLAGSVASGAMLISFLCSLALWAKLIALPEKERSLGVEFFQWIQVADLSVPAGFLVDQISIIMALVITGIGFLIHIFSIGYISHDERPTKYFAYLNFFVFNMLLLVLGDNLLMMFVGWEGVGLCSYLLIGFWFSDPQKAAAGMKAFITNRIGDAGFLLGIFLLFLSFGTLTYTDLFALLPNVAETSWSGSLTIATLCLFIGATGKSAQIPLYVWLPDAMAGPTPVSALIHAATMVTAGVYMIVRLNSLFVLTPNTMLVIAVIGGATALVAALIALTQNDIKKILAYSTVSQLGYMFLACGVGAFGAALFHVMTHAFFKALMFLGSGSVIHGMHEEQDIRKMGGLKKYMPITYLTFFVGWLAIIGTPLFSGFFSKDEILWFSFSSTQGHPIFWFFGVLTAGLTAFYMTRLMALTFWGESRFEKGVKPHESGLLMTLPLMVLAFLSLVGGYIGIPHVLGEMLPGHPPNILEHWLEPLVKGAQLNYTSHALELGLMAVSISVAGFSAWLAFSFYSRQPYQSAKFTQKFPKTYELVSNKFYVDEIYFSKVIDPILEMSRSLWAYIDVGLIDRVTHLASGWVEQSGRGLRSLQNGSLQQYGLYMVLGTVVILMFILTGI